MQDMECRMETMHMGRMIHMLSHQLKRRNIQEELMDEGLTGSQRHIMKFILLRTLHTDVYQKDIEEEFRIRKSTVTGILKLLEKMDSSGEKAFLRMQGLSALCRQPGRSHCVPRF